MKRIGIFGTSGFAREVDDVASALGFTAVFVAENALERSRWIAPDDVMLEGDVERYADMPFAIGIGNNAARQRVAEQYSGRLRFPALIHPAASFGKALRPSVEVRSGVIISAGARFMNNIEIGDFTVFNLNVTVGHDSIVERFAHLTPGVNVSGYVRIGERAWLGTGCAINQGSRLQRLSIGADTVVGSGAVVIEDCASHSVYAGVPARKIQ